MKKLLTFLFILLTGLFFATGCGGQSTAPSIPPSQPALSHAADTAAEQKKKENPYTDSASAPIQVEQGSSYTDRDHVALYVHQYGTLPPNYITKKEAQQLGWKTRGTLDQVAPGKSIGGDRFSNYEKVLPDKSGRSWRECDIDYKRGSRNGKRICYSSDGLIYYTDSHYERFERLY